jgi:UDP-N-acetylglucosamine 2-epimerase (non-hydrolysing)
MKQPTTPIIPGTRPGAIKMAPVIALLKNDSSFKVTVLSTVQHRKMLEPILGLTGVRPDIDLERRIGAR